MYNPLKAKFYNILTGDHQRTAKIRENFLFSFLIKELTMLVVHQLRVKSKRAYFVVLPNAGAWSIADGLGYGKFVFLCEKS
jgi:hypothetical protein